MDLVERVKRLMEETKDNDSSLAKKSGIPYTTVRGFFERGSDKAQMSTIQKLSEYFHVSIDYLVYGASGFSAETMLIASKIDAIDDPHSLELIRTVVDIEVKRKNAKSSNP